MIPHRKRLARLIQRYPSPAGSSEGTRSARSIVSKPRVIPGPLLQIAFVQLRSIQFARRGQHSCLRPLVARHRGSSALKRVIAFGRAVNSDSHTWPGCLRAGSTPASATPVRLAQTYPGTISPSHTNRPAGRRCIVGEANGDLNRVVATIGFAIGPHLDAPDATTRTGADRLRQNWLNRGSDSRNASARCHRSPGTTPGPPRQMLQHE